MLFDPIADAARRRESYVDHVVYEGDWARPDWGWWASSLYQAPITGEFGQLLEYAVMASYEGGKGREHKDDRTGKVTEGYPLRWARIIQTLDPGWNLMQLLAGKDGPGRSAPLYKETTRIGLEGAAWAALRKEVGLDAAFAAKQALGVALGSAGVGVTIEQRGMPPGLQVYAPHEVTFVGAAWNPLKPVVAIHHRSIGRVLASDISNPRMPIWGEWGSIDSLRFGSPPEWSLSGPEYPFRFGQTLLPHIIPTPGRTAPRALQPSARALRQMTIDAILQMGWVNLVARVGSFNRAVIVGDSDERPQGMEQLSLDPIAVSAVWGSGSKTVEEITNSVDAAQKLHEMAGSTLQTKLSALDGDLRVRGVQGAGVQSGRSIEIEREGVYLYARQQMQQQRPWDQLIVMLVAATYNWQVRNRLIDPGMLGMSTWEAIPDQERPIIDYPIVWSHNERTQIAKDLEPTDPVGAWMVRQGMDQSDRTARDTAYTEVSLVTRQRRVLIQQEGLGVSPDALFAARLAVAPTEDATTTYPVPSDVADTAARGLMLRDTPTFRGRGLVGLGATALLQRARSLQEQVPQTIGQVRALASWLLAHANDEDLPQDVGTWGDDDPSGLWIQWLSQGGEAAVAWCGATLNQVP